MNVPEHEAREALLAMALQATIDFAMDWIGHYECECQPCPQCGKMPEDCSKTDCAATCDCSLCEQCDLKRLDAHAKAALVQVSVHAKALVKLAQSAKAIRDCRREMIQHALSCPACRRGHAQDCDRNAAAWRTLLAAQTAEGESLDVLGDIL